MSKTIIITGAAGYVGGHTALRFKEAGYTVIGVDRAVTIPAAVEHLDEFLCTDFVDIVDYCAPLREASAVIHCAGTSLVGPSITDPGEYYNNNTAKTNRMLNWLADRKWSGSIIFSSSAAIYGNYAHCPIAESSAYKSTPINPYGWSKLMTERVIADHCRAHGFRGISLRYFNAAGCDPKGRMGCAQDGTHLVTRVVDSILSGKEIVINGNDYDTRDGTCVRDYVHVTDLADAHLEAVCLAEGMETGDHRSYNLGTGNGYTNKEILEQVAAYAGTKLNWCIGPRRDGDPDQLYADPRRFMQDTGWRPNHSNIADIASTTYNWMKKTYYND
jgi:UDP-glucose-4-epimerase GalE